MKLFRKIEIFLSKYSWFLKLGIVLLWIFWAGQIYGPVWSHLKTNVPKQSVDVADWTWEKEKQLGAKLNSFLNNKVLAVKTKGAKYSPSDYFRDLHEIEAKEKQVPITPRFYDKNLRITEMQALLVENIKKGYFRWEDAQRARNSYPEYRVERLKKGEFEKIFVRFLFGSFKGWVIIFYLRSLILVLLLYLVRMSQRKGILETIFADKKKFLISIFVWPIFIMKYPYNMVREILVEAELRRIGNLFRKLTPSERILVRKIAASVSWRQWIWQFRSRYREYFQRSLLLAITATIILYIIPAPSKAEQKEKIRDGPMITCSISDDSNIDNKIDNEKDILPEISFSPPVLSYQRLEFFLLRFVLGLIPKEILCIPISGRLVEGFLLQTKWPERNISSSGKRRMLDERYRNHNLGGNYFYAVSSLGRER